jgi:diguanylate cyclase
LSKHLRPTDLVARFGGEEFVVIFPESTLEEAFEAADRVRAVTEQTALESPAGDELPPVTLSIGVASFDSEHAPADLLKAADRAMYEAKNGGRNQVRAAE